MGRFITVMLFTVLCILFIDDFLDSYNINNLFNDSLKNKNYRKMIPLSMMIVIGYVIKIGLLLFFGIIDGYYLFHLYY